MEAPTRLTRHVAFILILSTWLLCWIAHVSATEVTADRQIDEVLFWLPDDTESILVIKRPFTNPERRDLPTTLGTQALIFTQMKTDPLTFSSLLKEQIEWAVVAARKFKAPRMLGAATYEGCSVLEFGSRTDTAASITKSLRNSADTIMKVAGKDVLFFHRVVSLPVPEDKNYYLCAPTPDIFIWATDENYLSTVLNRIGSHPLRRALPETLTEWKFVNRSADCWGVRHYATTGNEFDRTSYSYRGNPNPFMGPHVPVAGAHIDKDPQGVTFDYAGDSGNLRFLSHDVKAQDLRMQFWQAQRQTISKTLKSQQWISSVKKGAGVLDVEIKTTGTEPVPDWLWYYVLFVLGHEVMI